jgi:hypothetical protein
MNEPITLDGLEQEGAPDDVIDTLMGEDDA